MLDWHTCELVVVGPFKTGRRNVERLVTHDVGIEIPLRVVTDEIDRSVVGQRAREQHSVGGNDGSSRPPKLTDQASGVVDVFLESFRSEELHPVELNEQHDVEERKDDPQTANAAVHVISAVRCSCESRTRRASNA